MFKKLMSVMIIVALVFTLCACKAADDEDEAASGGGIVDSTDDDGSPDGSGSDNDSAQDDSAQDDSSTDGGSLSDNNSSSGNDNTSDDDDDKEDNTPPLSDSGKFTVTFDFGYDSKKETEKTDGKATEINPKRDGYEFEGWFDGNSKWDFSKTVTQDTTLKAKWKIITYKITYKAPGATLPSGNPTSYTVESGVAEFKAPTRPYRIFMGWAIENADGSTSNTSGSIAKGTVGDLVMIALWDEEGIALGSYEQDGDLSNGKEPIEWIKLKEEDGKGFFMAKCVLEGKPYQDPKKSVSWATCSLRSWLNGTFYNTAFSAEDKALVLQTDIHTPINDQLNRGVAVDTKDRVFILSLQEAEKLTTYAQRKAKVTDYAASQGCVKSGSGTADWWLRTVGYYDNYAAIVQTNSGIREGGYGVDMKTIGVRPCIWVDMSKLG